MLLWRNGYEIAYLQRTVTLHTSPITAVVIAKDGHRIISAAEDGMIYVWDLTGKEVRKIPGDNGVVYSLALTADGKYILSGSRDGTIGIWDLTGKEVRKIPGDNGVVYSLATTSDGKYIVAGEGFEIKIWDIRDIHNPIKRYSNESSWGIVRSVAVMPNGEHIISGGASLRIWNINDKITQENTLLNQDGFADPDDIYTIAITPDGKYIISGFDNGMISLWNSDKHIEIYKIHGHASSVNAIAITPDGKYIISGSSDKTIGIWEVGTGKKVHKFIAHSSAITGFGCYF
jgi:WD40 repeat protein